MFDQPLPLPVGLGKAVTMHLPSLLAKPTAWAALVSLVLPGIARGIDNLIFIAILSDKVPAQQQALARSKTAA